MVKYKKTGYEIASNVQNPLELSNINIIRITNTQPYFFSLLL